MSSKGRSWSSGPPASRRSFVPWPVFVVVAVMVGVLVALSGEYGFHGDEMYYVVAGRHPAFGYVDQPPLTPLLSAASVALLGVSPTAVRLLPTVEMAAAVIIVACMCRDLGGARRAQLLAAITASLSIYLASAHLDTTTDLDLLAWALVLWLMVRLLAGADRRLWLAVGVVGGLGLENKDTLVFLAVGLAAGSSSRDGGTCFAHRGPGPPLGWPSSCGPRTSPGRRPTTGRSSRWRAPSPRTRMTTVPSSCRRSGCSPARSSSP